MEFTPVPCVSKCQYCNEREPAINMLYGNPGDTDCHYLRCCETCKEAIFQHEKALSNTGVRRVGTDGTVLPPPMAMSLERIDN